MNILVTCNDLELANILNVVKKVLKLVQIVGPICCIVILVLLMINMAINPEEKKTIKKIINSVLALIIVFVIPILVDTVMLLIDEGSTISACWKEAEEIEEDDWEYIDEDKDKTNVIVDADSYK